MPTTHTIPVEDGQSVAAVHHDPGRGADGPDADERRWLVFCHGFRSDKSGSYEYRCERAAAEGYDAVRFDFRGCGESDGAFAAATLSARMRDLQAVVDHFDPDAYALFGSSFGGKVAFHTAIEDDRVAAVATRAPVTYDLGMDDRQRTVEEEGAFEYDSGHTIDERLFADLATYDFADVTAAIAVPVAIFHGRDDAKVPIDGSLRAVGALDVDTLLAAFAGEGHLFSEAAEDRLQDQLFAWLDAVG